MFLIIVGTGAMGKIVKQCAEEDEFFDEIYAVEPLEANWPNKKADLIIDFSHHSAIKGIYEYCREMNGGIPVVIGTTGQDEKDEAVISLLEKICPVLKKSNFSRGVDAMLKLVDLCSQFLPQSDTAVEEIHHTKKIDVPSGTAKTICEILGKDYKQTASIRMGTVPGKHTVYFAFEDEIIEISHLAFSKKIFAIGAIEAGKNMKKA